MDEVPAQAIAQTPDARLVSDDQTTAWNGAIPTEIYADAATGPATVILPSTGNVIVYKSDLSVNPVTVVPQGADTVMHKPNTVLTMQGETIHLRKKGTNWDAIG
ncbi:hypothetical protein F6V25_07975 [Oryzomonas japonica]|uniref:Uncharacterized protein n=1 Tax=Oryzomonas japonica TaxID=2603858 RepID=A0A7J4ZR55_9BACT|nr:hypothetical protein [Oryzomonas japonica]KAB0665650.1 hypothetical protein F6V25_07975 [Oryzomonas japonica]